MSYVILDIINTQLTQFQRGILIDTDDFPYIDAEKRSYIQHGLADQINERLRFEENNLLSIDLSPSDKRLLFFDFNFNTGIVRNDLNDLETDISDL